jgi:hypothetical protein
MLFLLPHSTKAAELIVNGGFETGNFTGWTATNASSFWRPWTISSSGAGGDEGGGGFTLPGVTSVQQGTRNAWHGITAGANQSFTLVQQITLPAATNVRLTWMDRYQMNYTQFCTSCGTANYAVEILNTSNVLLQTLYTVTTNSGTNSNTGWVNHIANLTPYAGQSIRIRFRTIITQSLQGPGQLEIDAVSAQTLQPTAANVSVGGRVLTDEGAGISRVSVTLTNGAGVSRSVTTNTFGYYNFTDVAAGETYILTVNNKKYLFADSPRVVNVQNDLADVDFRASP